MKRTFFILCLFFATLGYAQDFKVIYACDSNGEMGLFPKTKKWCLAGPNKISSDQYYILLGLNGRTCTCKTVKSFPSPSETLEFTVTTLVDINNCFSKADFYYGYAIPLTEFKNFKKLPIKKYKGNLSEILSAINSSSVFNDIIKNTNDVFSKPVYSLSDILSDKPYKVFSSFKDGKNILFLTYKNKLGDGKCGPTISVINNKIQPLSNIISGDLQAFKLNSNYYISLFDKSCYECGEHEILIYRLDGDKFINILRDNSFSD